MNDAIHRRRHRRRRSWRDIPKLMLAVRLANSLAPVSAFGPIEQGMDRLINRIQDLQSLWRQLQCSQAKNWQCSQTLLQRLSGQLFDLRNCCDNLVHPIAEALRSPRVLIGSVYEELVAAEEQFAEFSIEPRSGIVSIVSDPVELEGVTLGSFRIEIDINGIPTRQILSSVKTIALDPNPASNDDSVTHPHVRDQVPCLGDASLPVRNALREGRLCDAFQLISVMLSSYNQGSAYMALEDWSGQICSECARSSSSDDTASCDRCGCSLCSRCSTSCDRCGSCFCSSHLYAFNEEESLCRRCHDQAEADAQEEFDESQTSPA